jgi:hypothetical protein
MPVPPNQVFNPRADLATAPEADLFRQAEGSALRTSTVPASVIVADRLNDLLWNNRPFDSGVYTDYRIDLRVIEDTATAELPPQGGDCSYEVLYVPMAKPTLRLVAEWTAERAGAPPENPAKNLGDPNTVYLRGEWNPGGWEFDTDGVTSLFRCAGRYEYGFKKPSLARYGAGLPPWAAELMGLPARPYIYGTPNTSGIWPEPCGTTFLPPGPITQTSVPPREGVAGQDTTLTTSGGGSSLSNFEQQLQSWRTGQGNPPGGQ